MKKTLARTPKRRFRFKSFPFRARLGGGLALVALIAALSLAAPRPAHTAGGPIAVTVANAPLSTTAADNPAKQGVQYSRFVLVPGGSTGGFDSSYKVPAGKRLVIEFISASTNISTDQNHYTIFCDTQGGLGYGSGESSFNVSPGGSPFSTGNVHPYQYADAGSSVYISAYSPEFGGNFFLFVTVTGYLVDVP